MTRHAGAPRGAARLAGSAALVLVASVLLAAPAPSQNIAVGAAAFALNDTGTAANLSGFETWGGYAFGELALDMNAVLQVRVQRFTLPGTAPAAPRIGTWAGNVTIGYLFQEDWWRGGFIGGVGIYSLKPYDPNPGQVASDPSETVFGWHGGLLTIFRLGTRWDLRLEATGHLVRSTVSHTPIMLTGGAAYHF